MYDLPKNTAGQDSGFMISAMDSRLRGAGFEPWPGHPTLFLN